ncbi:hypothetical protein LTR85_000624 [Meristemomyces frigidus]|nr:hypothetical protein LTR85_000624 [Meristemomyces frigidus]
MADVADDKKKEITDEKFFFAIIKQLDGSIDWQKVADEAGIVSKGAASKRFSRMKLKFEKAGSEAGGSPTKATTPAGDGEEKKTKRAPSKKATNKKRKLEEATEEIEEKPVKDEEGEEA